MSNITYIGLVRDHSGSMRPLTTAALNDYNLTVDGIRQSVTEEGQKAFVSVVECGVGSTATSRLVNANVPIENLPKQKDYIANGGATPLWDSVGMVIDAIEANPHKDDVTTAFLVMIITDGQENNSKKWSAASISQKIKELQATDRWTFTFRVPRGSKKDLVRLGIPDGNIMEWEQNEQSFHEATVAQTSSVGAYFSARTRGMTSMSTFYADPGNISVAKIDNALDEITAKIKRQVVSPHQDGIMIKDFCTEKFGRYDIGKAYYQLTKTEKVQQSKDLIILDRQTNKAYGGNSARSLLGLPQTGEIRLAPGNFGQYEVYVKSTSINRKLYDGNAVIYKN
tara:strand:+ start:620 stop:1636 length:1017 start_codon:yes stop_codon:yes gene_type:complete